MFAAVARSIRLKIMVMVLATSAANLVRHFNVNPVSGSVDPTLPNYVPNWIVGNEPNANGFSASSYSAYFNAGFDAMKAVDSRIKIGGPGIGWYDRSWNRRRGRGNWARRALL